MAKKTNGGPKKPATTATKPGRNVPDRAPVTADYAARAGRILAVQRDPVTGMRISLTAPDPAPKRPAEK